MAGHGKKRYGALVPEDAHEKYGPHGNKYKPENGDIVKIMAQSGMFPEEWCAHLGVTMPTLFNWANRHPDFDQAVHEAWWLLRAYWTQQARESIQGRGMAHSILAMILEKRFPDTWGKNARNTHQTFKDRNKSDDPEALDDTSPEALRSLSDDEINARINVLQQRRKEENEG